MIERLGEGAPAARGGELARFALVGASGAVVNLAALHLAAEGLGAPEVAASALAIEVSILWNFLLHEVFTFRKAGLGAAGVPGRLLRYHAVSVAGGLVQLGVFTAAVAALAHGGALDPMARVAAQGAGIAAAFAVTWLGSSRFAWGARVPAQARIEPAGPVADRLAPFAFLVVLALHVVPIWAVALFPTQDGPLHVENVLALLRYDRSPFLQAWYEANWGAQPNWLTQFLFAGLLPFVSPLVAEKLVLTGYTLLLPLAFRSVLPPGRLGWWAALLVFPFVHSFPFHMGFWNFCWGLGLAFLTVGFWLRSRGRLGPGRFLVLAILSVLLFLAHSVAFASAFAAIGTLLVFRAGLALRRARGNPDRVRLVLQGWSTRAAGVALAGAPGLLLLASWMSAHADRVASRIPFVELAAKLAAGYAMVSIDRRELLLGPLVTLLLFVGAVHLALDRAARGTRLRPHDGWLVAAALFGVLYFAVPDVVAAGAHVSDRFALTAFLCAAAWLGSGARAPVRRLAVAAGAVAIVALGVRLDKQLVLSEHLAEYVSGSVAIPGERVLLPVAVEPAGPRDEHGRNLGYRVKPFLHATGWIVAEKGGVDLKNSQAHTDHCPVRFPAGRDPFITLAGSLDKMEGVPPCLDLGAASRARIDYLLLWGGLDDELPTPCGREMARQLAEHWTPVWRSSPRGLLEVWRPRAGATTLGPSPYGPSSSGANAPVLHPRRIESNLTRNATAIAGTAASSPARPRRPARRRKRATPAIAARA